MADAYEMPGVYWLVGVLIIGVGLGFALRRLRLIDSNKATTNFVTWASGVFAAVVALVADVSSSSGVLIDVLGRVAIFFLVWLAAGLMLAVGVATGIEKSDDRREKS